MKGRFLWNFFIKRGALEILESLRIKGISGFVEIGGGYRGVETPRLGDVRIHLYEYCFLVC